MAFLLNPFLASGAGDLGPFEYTNTWGQGDRTADLIVTALDYTPASSSSASNIVNGSLAVNSSGGLRYPSGSAAKTTLIEFPSLVQIDQFNIIMNQSTAMGDWNFQASTDNVSFTAVCTTFTWAGTNFVVDATSTPSLRYLKIEKQSGSTSGIPYFLELNLRIRAA